jgi:hypothetical protein
VEDEPPANHCEPFQPTHQVYVGKILLAEGAAAHVTQSMEYRNFCAGAATIHAATINDSVNAVSTISTKVIYFSTVLRGFCKSALRLRG